MSVLSNSQLLKNIKRDKELLKSCYKLDKTLKTAQVYMHKNSKYLDNSIFLMLFKEIAKNTDKILPNDCKITKPLNLSYTMKNKPTYCNFTKDNKRAHYKPMQYIVKKLFINNTSNARKLFIHTAKCNRPDLNYQDYVNQDLTKAINQSLNDMGYLSTKDFEHKVNHEKEIENHVKKLNHLSFIATMIGFVILFSNHCSIDLRYMAYGGWAMFIIFGVITFILYMSNVLYEEGHLDTDDIIKDTEITEGQFTVIINHLMSNNNKVIDKTFKNLSLCRKDYHLNLSPEEHLKDIKNNGTSWTDAVQKTNE